MDNAWTERIKELEAEIAKLTTALKDKPDQSDLDAAVFRLEKKERRCKKRLKSQDLKPLL
jgi:predicted DNA binding CopG/RHH family protein